MSAKFPPTSTSQPHKRPEISLKNSGIEKYIENARCMVCSGFFFFFFLAFVWKQGHRGAHAFLTCGHHRLTSPCNRRHHHGHTVCAYTLPLFADVFLDVILIISYKKDLGGQRVFLNLPSLV